MSSINQLILQRLHQELEDLKQRHEQVISDRRGASGDAVAQFNIQLQSLETQMLGKEAEIRQKEAEMADQTSQGLVQLLERHRAQIWNQAIAAYQLTRQNWFQRNDAQPSSPTDLVNRLTQILPKPDLPYSAREEFVVHLIAQEQVPTSCLEQLKSWIREAQPDLDLEGLQRSLKEQQEDQVQQSRLGLVFVFTKEEVTSIEESENYYRLSAWLAEHVQKPATYHQLPVNLDPAPISNLKQSFSAIKEEFDNSRRSYCSNIRRAPEVHIFLPQDLLNVATNEWNYQQGNRSRCFEHQYEVYLHCAERYQGNYQTIEFGIWDELWKHAKRRLPLPAEQSFLPGDDADLNELDCFLNDQLDGYDCCDDHPWVGVKLNRPPSPSVDERDSIFQLLLEYGIPLILWGRTDMVDGSYCSQLDAVLTQGTLEELGKSVREKRRETRLAGTCPRETHIGHHLALVWDDPTIRPLIA